MGGDLLTLGENGGSKLGGAHRLRFEVMSQFQAQVPYPLRDQLPAFLAPGGMATPSVGILLDVFVRECWLKGPTMQIQLDHIAGSERLLREVREEQFVDDAFPRDTYRALLLGGWMGGHDHAAQHTVGSDRDIGTIVEGAYHLAFRALLELIGRQVQTRLNEWMIEDRVLLATGHKGEARHLGERGPCAILAVEPEQRAPWFKLRRGERARDRCQSLAQFLAVMAIASVSETAELLIAMRL